ncbi:uncharacterized protein PG986_002070 [Apiospora aurea]|uniref:Uncharacterized protein n=1 Tax=Apiospora aurea TaxID=335848 RepID=A0ABR1QYP7_9PEZI
MKECQPEDALDRLWAAAISRTPWRGAPHLHLGRDATFDMELVCAKAERHGIQGMRRLPPELVRVVYDYSSLATFWRYVAIVSLARELGKAPMDSVSLPLRDVLAWTRGRGPPSLVQSSSPERPPSSIRLTFDGHGIRQIERLPGIPPFRRWNSENMSFGGFHIWDMPDPPPLAGCRFARPVMPQATQFLTVDLRGATGLTFHFDHGKVYEISTHTRAAPYAKRAAVQQQSGRRVAERTVWVHLPITKGEEILGVALRMTRAANHNELSMQKPCFLFRMKLAGDISLGPDYSEYEDVSISQPNPELLIYNTLSVGPATLFGTYPWHSTSEQGTNEVRRLPHPPRHLLLRPAGQRHAFTSPRRRGGEGNTSPGSGIICHAILLDYANGARRALGNCRLGVDSVAGTYPHPARICYRVFTQTTATATILARGGGTAGLHRVAVRWAIQVEGGSEAAGSAHEHRSYGGWDAEDEDDDDEQHDHQGGNDGWVCSNMQGNMMKMWFSAEQSIMSIVPRGTPPSI